MQLSDPFRSFQSPTYETLSCKEKYIRLFAVNNVLKLIFENFLWNQMQPIMVTNNGHNTEKVGVDFFLDQIVDLGNL